MRVGLTVGGKYEVKWGRVGGMAKAHATAHWEIRQDRNVRTGRIDNSTGTGFNTGVGVGGKIGQGVGAGQDCNIGTDRVGCQPYAEAGPLDDQMTFKIETTIPVLGPLLGVSFSYELNLPAAARSLFH